MTEDIEERATTASLRRRCRATWTRSSQSDQEEPGGAMRHRGRVHPGSGRYLSGRRCWHGRTAPPIAPKFVIRHRLQVATAVVAGSHLSRARRLRCRNGSRERRACAARIGRSTVFAQQALRERRARTEAARADVRSESAGATNAEREREADSKPRASVRAPRRSNRKARAVRIPARHLRTNPNGRTIRQARQTTARELLDWYGPHQSSLDTAPE